MRCEEVRPQLPDYVLDTLGDLDRATVKAHLRGCSACRVEAARLDEGVSLFASAAHEVTPPPTLVGRVMGVLAEEWSAGVAARPRFLHRRSFLMAAAAVLLAGILAWGSVAQVTSNRNSEDAAAYRNVLATLGGRDVRVAALQAVADSGVEGSAILYDSDREQSWALVLVRAPGYQGRFIATLSGPRGHAIEFFAIEIERDGDGATWLVTSADISSFDLVRVTTPDGTVVAQGRVSHEH